MAITIDEIRALDSATDSVAAVQSGTWNIGTVTAVTDITNVVSVDDNGGSLTIDNAGLATIAGAVAGTEMQVDIVSSATLTVSAVNLDIRDLTSVSDSVSAVQSGTWNIGTVASITADVNIADGGNVISIDDAGGSLTVDGTVAATQSGTWNVNTVPGGFASWKVSVETVGVTESELVSTPLASRLGVIVQNLGAGDVYIKEATGVTSANGLKIPRGSSFEYSLDDGANIFAISSIAATNVRVAEFAA